MYKFKTKEELLVKSKEVLGKTFGQIDKHNRISDDKNFKGSLGHIIEESFFEYDINNDTNADFKEINVELKVTPYKINKNGSYSAKERLVLNMIDYFYEGNADFENSSFWKKNKSLLIMFYLHEFEKLKKEFVINETILFEYPKEDLLQIKKDFDVIKNKIKSGLAHEISETDTYILAACTKGRDSNSLKKQPFSNHLAKSRAYSLKSSYMTYILRTFVLGNKKNDKIFKDISLLKKYDLEEFINEKINRYRNYKTEQLLQDFNISNKAKNFRALIISKILDVQEISKTDEFIKSGIKFKTILVSKNNKIKEHMSFPYFNFFEVYEETWETSQIKEMFETTKFVFAVFKEDINGDEYFENIVFWSMPENIIENELKETWSKTKNVISTGEIVSHITIDRNNKSIHHTNFPNGTLNSKVHVRPHAKDFNDVLPLPVRDIVTGKKHYMKHCFWLDRNFILSILKIQ